MANYAERNLSDPGVRARSYVRVVKDTGLRPNWPVYSIDLLLWDLWIESGLEDSETLGTESVAGGSRQGLDNPMVKGLG